MPRAKVVYYRVALSTATIGRQPFCLKPGDSTHRGALAVIAHRFHADGAIDLCAGRVWLRHGRGSHVTAHFPSGACSACCDEQGLRYAPGDAVARQIMELRAG